MNCRRPRRGFGTSDCCGDWPRPSAKEPSLCLQRETLLRTAAAVPWPQLQRVLVAPRIEESLCFADAVARVVDGTTDQTDYCRQMLARPANELNPPPLITGEDLMQMGIPRGPVYRELLDRVRDEQLAGRIGNSDEARSLAASLWNDGRTG